MADNCTVTIKVTDKLGRHAVASRAFKAGDSILCDTPFAYGPKSESRPLCLGCMTPIECQVLCANCSWPVCGMDCRFLSVHQKNECEIFAKAGLKFQTVDDPTDVCLQYECITPLRVLLAKERDPNLWEELKIIETHNEERKTQQMWHFNQANVIDFLRGPCKLERFSEDLIHTVCGMLDINCLEARTSYGYLIRCLYPKLVVISHKCVANVCHTISPGDFRITLRAAVDIPENGKLFYNYTYSLWPTLVRRTFLMQNKYFECKCERCQDKTELRTHLGTLKCNKCDNGIILSNDPLSFTCEWKCTHCEFKTSAVSIKKVYDVVQAEIDSIDWMTGEEGLECREALYRKYRSVFHPKNGYMNILRTTLSQLYGRAPGYTLHELPDLLQERKVELCRQLLEVLDVVEPGLTRTRGITLYELHSPLINLAKNEYNTDMISREHFRQKMEEAADILRQSAEILKYEVPDSNEGQLGLVAQQSYEILKQNFELLIATA